LDVEGGYSTKIPLPLPAFPEHKCVSISVVLTKTFCNIQNLCVAEEEEPEDFDLQSDELENLRQFWTNTRRHERLHDNEDVSGMFRDLDLQLSQLKKPSSFMAPIANVPHVSEIENDHLTVDEMEDLGNQFSCLVSK